MVTAVSPTSTIPDHDLTFSDGSTTIGVILTDDQGNPFERAIQETPLQRTALKTSTGENKYSDFELPYMSIVQDDWSGGRGALNFEDDKTRYYDGYRINTENANVLLPGPKEVYQSAGIRTFTQNINHVGGESANPNSGQVNFLLVPQNGNKHAQKITGTFTLNEIWIWVQRVGTPTGTLTVELWSDSSGPSAKLNDIGTLTTTTVTDTEPELRIFTPTAGIAIAGTYWIVIRDTLASSSTTNCWKFGYAVSIVSTNAATYNGATWTASYNYIFYRCVDDTTLDGGLFFEYKRAKYVASQPSAGGNSTIYINGDRGAADSNTADKTLVNDATKTWTNDEWIGCVVLITKGPGSEEYQPWREIYDNTAAALYCFPDWEVTHTTATEYVILGSKKWTSWQAVSKPVSDVAVAGDNVYLACTEANVVSRFIEHNIGGVWTKELAAETIYADKLIATRDADSTSGYFLWGSQNSHTPLETCIWKCRVPPIWGATGVLYHVLRELVSTSNPWDTAIISNVTQSTYFSGTSVAIAAGFGTGIVAEESIEATDITDGYALGFWIKSTVACNANDLSLLLYSTYDAGYYERATSSLYINTTDMTGAHDQDTAVHYDLTLTTADYIYVRSTLPFHALKVNMVDGGTVNDIASVMTGEYVKNGVWTAITITDGTITSGKTLTKDGYITWAIPDSWQESTYNAVSGYWMRFKVSVNLTASIDVAEITLSTHTNYHSLNIPALTANTWTWCQVALGTIYPEYTSVDSIALNVAVDNGAQTVYFYYGIQLLAQEPPRIRLDSSLHINGLEKYGEERENPWVFTNGVPFEIQTQNDDAVIPLPIGEMNAFQSENNGKAHCVNGVYLYFSMGEEKLERYYNRNLDDVGPDREEGLPSIRRGNISALVSYPGRVFAAVDATRISSDYVTTEGYSSLLVLKGSAWHEIYRAPSGKSITSVTVQSIPGTSTARIWMLQDADLVYIGYNLNPTQDTDYQYTHYASLITGYITGNMLNVIKAWKSLSIFQDNPDSLYTYVDYRKDSDTAWTPMSESFQTAPVEENNLSSATPPNLTGKRLQMRLRLSCGAVDLGKYQKILATMIEAYGVVPPKYGWGFATVIHDDYIANLQGADMSSLGISTAAETAYAQIKTWAAAATPLTMHSRFSLYDNKTVIIEPPASRPLIINSEGQIEQHIAHLTCHEL